MKKNLVILSAITLVFINLASAYSYSSSDFSISNLLDSIDSSTMVLGAVFIISFIFLHFALSKFFKDNRTSAGIMSFVVSLFITWGINKTGFDVENLFYSIGIPSEFLYTILPFVLIAGFIYLLVKFGKKFLFIFGALLILIVSFTDLIYEGGLIFFGGCVLIGIGIVWWWISRGAPYKGGIGRGTWKGAKGVAKGARWAGRKSWSESLARGRGMSKRRAENKAYKEKPRKDAEIKAKKKRNIRTQMKDIAREIKMIRREINRNKSNISSAVTQQQVAILQQEIIRLEQGKNNYRQELRKLAKEFNSI